MHQITEANGQIEFIKRMSTGLRIFVFVVGLFPFLAPYELLIRPGWQGFSPLLLPFIIISLGASIIGITFMLAGILGLNQRLVFDAKRRITLYAYETSVTPLREQRYPFPEVGHIAIITHDWDSGPSTYSLQVTFADNRKVDVGQFTEKGEAEQYLSRIERLIR